MKNVSKPGLNPKKPPLVTITGTSDEECTIYIEVDNALLKLKLEAFSNRDGSFLKGGKNEKRASL
jgi:hypothetical protein